MIMIINGKQSTVNLRYSFAKRHIEFVLLFSVSTLNLGYVKHGRRAAFDQSRASSGRLRRRLCKLDLPHHP